ncbi:hypothetical protein OAQ84_01860, partial [Bdellovibrionales bacterium]|nr:hypothetical protein [Bdellovibrionales bacterium]
AVELMGAGAYGSEALEIVLAFDRGITQNRWRSQKRVPVSFEGFFNSKLDSLYSSIKPKIRHLAFRHVASPIEIIGDASANIRPGRINESDLEKIDFIIYGSYSTSDRYRASWNLFLYVVNVKTGVTRVLKGYGDTQKAAEMVAEKLFRLFQTTTFPSTIRYGRGKTLELLASETIKSAETTALSKSYRLAEWACEDLGGRLPSEREMAAVERAGDFGGGVTLNARFRDHYYWALELDDVYVLTMRKAFPIGQLNSHSYLKYICVKSLTFS